MKLKDAIELAKEKYHYSKGTSLEAGLEKTTTKTPRQREQITKRHRYFMSRYGWTFEQAQHWIQIQGDSKVLK